MDLKNATVLENDQEDEFFCGFITKREILRHLKIHGLLNEEYLRPIQHLKPIQFLNTDLIEYYNNLFQRTAEHPENSSETNSVSDISREELNETNINTEELNDTLSEMEAFLAQGTGYELTQTPNRLTDQSSFTPVISSTATERLPSFNSLFYRTSDNLSNNISHKKFNTPNSTDFTIFEKCHVLKNVTNIPKISIEDEISNESSWITFLQNTKENVLKNSENDIENINDSLGKITLHTNNKNCDLESLTSTDSLENKTDTYENIQIKLPNKFESVTCIKEDILKTSEKYYDSLNTDCSEKIDSALTGLSNCTNLTKSSENNLKKDKFCRVVKKSDDIFKVSSRNNTPIKNEIILSASKTVKENIRPCSTLKLDLFKSPIIRSKTVNYKNIQSPIARYITESPTVPFKTNVVHKTVPTSVHNVNQNTKKFIQNFSPLPTKSYKPIKNVHLTSEERAAPLPKNVSKYISKPLRPEIIKHTGRVNKKEPVDSESFLAESRIEDLSSFTDLENTNVEMSVMISLEAKKTSMLKK